MVNSRNVDDLHPTIKRGYYELYNRAKAAGYNLIVTSTFRDFEQQNALYAQGRTTPGAIVTNAKAGQSIHNYRLAFDICKNVVGHEYDDINFFNAIGKIGMALGFTWGGTFTGLVDKPHFEYTHGLTLKQLQQGALVPNDAKMPWEKTITPVAPATEPDSLVTTTPILYNNTKITVERILWKDTNYIKLRDLEKFGFRISYDTIQKLPVITKA